VAAPKGNNFGLKLKEPDIRQEAYKKYCEHLAKGKSKRSFVFRSLDYSCHWQTLESYIKDKEEFDPLQMEYAKCDGYAEWEQVVEDSARGINKDANTASLQMLMRNKFDWDKPVADEDKYTKTQPVTIMLNDMDKLNAGSQLLQQADSKLPEREEED